MEEITRFLQEIPPFSQLSASQIERMANTVQIEYFASGHDVLVYKGKPSEYLYIVRQGSVDLLREDERGIRVLDTLSEGEIFGYPSLLRGQPPIVTVRTREETLAYLIPATMFHQMRRDVPAFNRFFATTAVERISQRLHARDANAAPELFRLRLRDLVRHALISVGPDVTVRQAAAVMSEHNVSSLIITSSPPGIITDRDLRNRVLARGLNDTTPVTRVMTAPLMMLPAESLVFEALVTMLSHGFHHMPVSDNGQIIGMVTHTDIMRQQSKNPLFLPRQLQRARTIEDLQFYVEQVTATVGVLLEAGARVSDIGRVVAVAHDALIERLLRDAEKTLGSPPCPYAWLALGSEGRYEQLLRTDQDNALVYADAAPPDAAEYFENLSQHVVSHLIKCGFPPCPGDVMATNPHWRQPLHVWKSYFNQWIGSPTEQTLLRVATFFDYRKIYGGLDVEAALRPIIQKGASNRVFLGRLARVTLRQPAPLSFFRQLVLEHDGKARDLIDLKARGTTLIVDLARLFALEAGCPHTNSFARLRHCIEKSSLSKTGSEELTAAYELISLFRLRYQYQQVQRGGKPTNQVPVSWLKAMERRELKEALWAVARIQRSTELLFQTDLFARTS